MLKGFFFLTLFSVFFKKNKSNTGYLTFLMFVLFLTITLRHKVCFLDTYNYVQYYDLLKNIDFSNISNNWSKDISFWYLSKAISLFSNGNYTIWFGTLAISYIIPLYLLLKKYSQNIQISLILFCCLGFALFSMTGLRQTLAMGFTMGALYCLLNSKKTYFLLLVILGSLFHMSAIVFLMLYPLTKLPTSKKYIFIYIIFGVIIYYVFIKYLPILLMSSMDSRFEVYLQSDSKLNYTGLIRQILLFIISFIYLGNNRRIYTNRIFLIMSITGIFFQSMAGIVPEMFRLSMYFSIANIFLLSNALTSNPKARSLKYFIILILTLYFITSENAGFLNNYYFFFQNVPNIVFLDLHY